MENFLRNNFAAHYNQPTAIVADIYQDTNATYFEIEDNENQETVIHFTQGNGVAIYSNPNNYTLGVINYDKFITSLSHRFQQGKGRCDLIVYTINSLNYFLLNELKNRTPTPDVVEKGKSQLLKSLTTLLDVPTVYSFIQSFITKRCCFFNKQIIAPSTISATTAFGRVNTLNKSGFRMTNTAIEALGFEYYEYSGEQIFTLN